MNLNDTTPENRKCDDSDEHTPTVQQPIDFLYISECHISQKYLKYYDKTLVARIIAFLEDIQTLVSNCGMGSHSNYLGKPMTIFKPLPFVQNLQINTLPGSG